MKKLFIALFLMITAALVFGESRTIGFSYVTGTIELPSAANVWFSSDDMGTDSIIIPSDTDDHSKRFEINVATSANIHVKLTMKPLRRNGEENGTVIPSTVTAENIQDSNEMYKLTGDPQTIEWNIEADEDKSFQYKFMISVSAEDYDSAAPDTYKAEFIAEVSEGTK